MSVRKEKRAGGRPTKNPGVEVLEKLYVEEDKSAREIAKMYGVSPRTVQGWLYRAPANDEQQR